MMSNKLTAVLATITVLLFVALYGSLIFTVWNLKVENAIITSKLHRLEQIVDSTNTVPGQAVYSLRNRMSRETSTSDLQLTEMIEKKLYSIMDCRREIDNVTNNCSLKPGPKGEKGDPGEEGKEGPTGEPGERGQKGHSGDKGEQGLNGRRGPKGDTGVVGPRGGIGPAGPQGATGEKGPRGEFGLKGLKGEHGYPGYKGSIGLKGEPGLRGLTGPKGERGLMGAQGEHGYPGYKGEKGEKGVTGARGPLGPMGPPGVNSTNLQLSLPDASCSSLYQLTLGSVDNPAVSCSDLNGCGRQSGFYLMKSSADRELVRVYCDLERACCGNTSSGWMRVAEIDMTDPIQQCPDRFKLISRTEPPLRTCGRRDYHFHCVSTTFPVHGIQYSRVCGRIVGYQIGSPEAFYGYNDFNQSIDGYYTAGISLTHGHSPRKHIWTFANAAAEGSMGGSCPCMGGPTYVVPLFIEEDYFCDTAVRGATAPHGMFFADDPLWDGQGCGGTSTCCEFNNPPWFCKQLPQPTTDDIELRICENSSPRFDDTSFEIVEMYIN